MSKKEEWKNKVVVLRNVRMGFPNLFTATVNPQYPNQTPSYSAQFEIEKGSENETLLNAAIKSVLTEQYGEKAEKKLNEYRVNKMKYPIKDGDDMDKDWAKGKIFLTAKRQKTLGSVKVIDGAKQDMSSDDDRITSGAITNVKIVIASQPGVNDGVRCQLQAVQYVKAGEGYAQDIGTDEFEEIQVDSNEDLFE